jgi:predicted dehydrogenase
VRVAFAGVAHSHAFVDAVNLDARGAHAIGVWDADDPARRSDFARRFGTTEYAEIDELLAERPDVVVATPRTTRSAEVALACARAAVPVFFNKTIAADASSLARWAALPAAPRFTSSVLRFAPALRALAVTLADRPLRAIELHAQHDIAGFLAPDRRWQDDPAGAGGTMVNIGLHAWEMLDVIAPGTVVQVLSASRVIGASSTDSELLASVHARAGELPVSVTISGVGGVDRYAARVWTDDGIHELVLPDDLDGLGYGGTADAVVRLAGGLVPVDAARTAAVYGNTLAAAGVARDRPPRHARTTMD